MSRQEVISRYEGKYLIPEGLATEIRRSLRGLCSPDRHSNADGTYVVNTLYFETPDLRFYYDTRFKRFPRYKVRVRYYGVTPQAYIWVELKHKLGQVTWKTRRKIRTSEWPGLIETPGMVVGPGAGPSVLVGESFESAVMRSQARPIVHVRYLRQAYVSDLDAYGRVTFDRCLTFRPARGSFELWPAEEMIYYDDAATAVYPVAESPVVLEIKSETRIPCWMPPLIQRFELSWRGFSKYCCAVDKMRAASRSEPRRSVWI